MEIIEVTNVTKLLLGAKIIGKGTTSICFLLSNGKVFKMYLPSINKEKLFGLRKNVKDHLAFLSSIDVEYYITPDDIYTKNGKILGYTMTYVKGKTLSKINTKIKFNELISSLDDFITATIELSKSKCRLIDLNTNNIIYNGHFYGIDLDYCDDLANLEEEYIIQNNIKKVLIAFISGLFKSEIDISLEYCSNDLNHLSYDTLYVDYHLYKEFLMKLKEELEMDNPTIKQIRANSKKIILRKHDKYDY